jgi:hypothetical protein
MFTFDRKPRSWATHSPAPRPLPHHPSQVSPVRPLWSRLATSNPSGTDAESRASSPVAPGLQFNLARIPILPQVQRKATVSSPRDPFEHEANNKVTPMAELAPIGSAPAAIQRECAACGDEEEKTIQTKGAPLTNAGPALDTGAAARAAQRGGEPLPEAVRSFFEPRFGHDFSQVRVHADGEAARAARAVRARAYTLGRHIVFGDGQYQFATDGGKLLLAHELTHVVQQRGGGGGTEVARQEDNAPSTSTGVAAQNKSEATRRLLAIIADIEQMQRKLGPTSADAASGADDTLESQTHKEEIAAFLQRLRDVANGSDEGLKSSVLVGFSAKSVEQAEAQPEAKAVVRELSPEGVATKSLEVSHPHDAQEIEADRVAAAVVHGGPLTVTQSTSGSAVNRAGEELAALGAFIVAAEAESLPLTSWNPPGWVVLGVASVVAAALIGTGVYMASAQPETLSAAEIEAIELKEAGKPYDKATYNRARKKQVKNEKFDGNRNINKPRSSG